MNFEELNIEQIDIKEWARQIRVIKIFELKNHIEVCKTLIEKHKDEYSIVTRAEMDELAVLERKLSILETHE